MHRLVFLQHQIHYKVELNKTAVLSNDLFPLTLYFFYKTFHQIFQKPLDDLTLSFVVFKKAQVLILFVIKYIKKHFKKNLALKELQQLEYIKYIK